MAQEDSLQKVHPPYTNRGVTNPNTPNPMKPFYDWFQGTITGDWLPLQERLLALLEGKYDTLKSTQYGHKGVFIQRGWKYGFEFIREGRVILSLSYGGQNSRYGIGFKATGRTSMELATLLQGEFIEYQDGVMQVDFSTSSKLDGVLTVSRMDVAIDAVGDFDSIVKQVKPLALDLGMDLDVAGDWLVDGSPKGRTLYIKRTNSDKMRIYEKGKEQRTKGEDPEAPLDWVRFEIQINSPKGKQNKHFKLVMAGQTPLAVLESYKEYVSTLNAVGGAEFEYKAIQRTLKPKPTTAEEKRHNMIVQYSQTLQDCLESPKEVLRLATDLVGGLENLPPWLQRLALMNGAYAENDGLYRER